MPVTTCSYRHVEHRQRNRSRRSVCALIGTMLRAVCLPDSYNGSLMAVAVVDAEPELVDGLYASPELWADAMHTVERQSYRLDRKVAMYGS